MLIFYLEDTTEIKIISFLMAIPLLHTTNKLILVSTTFLTEKIMYIQYAYLVTYLEYYPYQKKTK